MEQWNPQIWPHPGVPLPPGAVQRQAQRRTAAAAARDLSTGTAATPPGTSRGRPSTLKWDKESDGGRRCRRRRLATPSKTLTEPNVIYLYKDNTLTLTVAQTFISWISFVQPMICMKNKDFHFGLFLYSFLLDSGNLGFYPWGAPKFILKTLVFGKVYSAKKQYQLLLIKILKNCTTDCTDNTVQKQEFLE